MRAGEKIPDGRIERDRRLHQGLAGDSDIEHA
jgi:hypothetical protein